MHQNRAIKINTEINGEKKKERDRRQQSAKCHKIQPKTAPLTQRSSKEGRGITRKPEIPSSHPDNNLLCSLVRCNKDFFAVRRWICFFLFKQNQSLITFRNTKSFSISNLCMRLEWFSTRWASSPRGKMLPLACDGCCQEKERKNQHTTKKTTV